MINLFKSYLSTKWNINTIIFTTFIVTLVISLIILLIMKPNWILKCESTQKQKIVSIDRLLVFSLLFGLTLTTVIFLIKYKI